MANVEMFNLNIEEGCVILSAGSKKSGKSTFMLSILKACIQSGKFDEYHLIFPSLRIEADNAYDFLHSIKQVYFYEIYHELIVERLLMKQMKDKDNRILLVIDDATQFSKELHLGKNENLLKLISQSRHVRITTWVLVHTLKNVLSPVMRESIRYMFLCDVSNIKILKDVHEEYLSTMMNFDEFMKMWHAHQELEHPLMMIRLGKDRLIINDLWTAWPWLENFRKLKAVKSGL